MHSVLPLVVIIILLCLLFVPVESGIALSFVVGAVMLIVGEGMFTLGADLSMTQIGSQIGSKLTKSRRLPVILIVSFLIGVIITVAEPDLQVLANNVPAIKTSVLIITVSVGVGFFLTVSMLRIMFGVPLKWLFLLFYILIFALAAFSSPDFWAVAFDSGGVTTGPMTVPFIMALGVGVASIRSDEKAKSDSFGLVALCSIGPIAAVLILGFIYPQTAEGASASEVCNYIYTTELGRGYLSAIPDYMGEVSLALLPIFAFFLVFQIISLKLKKRRLIKIIVGLLYTYAGLVLFLTGVNVGFSSLGYTLGEKIGSSPLKFALVPLAMLMGWFIINAEPAVHVLNKQVEELSAGAITEKAMGISLSIAISAANGLSMIRILTGISIMWFIIPGYLVALALTFFVPQTFSAIAFDSGGVASGPLTAAFMLPFAMGATTAVGGNIMTDAFGLVALVAMTPLITIQIMGAIYVLKQKKAAEAPAQPSEPEEEYEIIELWDE